MRIERMGAAITLLLLALGAAVELRAQSTAIITVQVDSGRIRRDSCSITVLDTVTDGARTDLLRVRFIRAGTETATVAPFDLVAYAGTRDSIVVPKDSADAKGFLVHAQVQGSRFVVTQQGQDAALCTMEIEEEEDLEADPSFSLLAGVEFLSGDGFTAREIHIPAVALWSIPIRVGQPDTVRVSMTPAERAAVVARYPGVTLTRADTTHLRIRRGRVYSTFTAASEFTRLLSRRTFLSCVASTVAREGSRSIGSDGAECAPRLESADSVTVFSERTDSANWQTLGAWRTYGNFRYERNLRWSDFDVFAGPTVSIGFQTDPGTGSQDFFGIFAGGLSLTQVEITDEYWAERFHLRVMWGKAPNYASEVVTLENNSSLNRSIDLPASWRWHVLTSFQPYNGYFLRGSAEFGHGVPDVARISIVTKLNLQRIVRGIIGEKSPIPGF